MMVKLRTSASLGLFRVAFVATASLLFLAFDAAAQTGTQKPDANSPLSVPFCDILKNPSEWNGRVVEIRGVLDYGLRPEKECAVTFVTNGHIWPQAFHVRGSREGDELLEESFLRDVQTWDDYVTQRRPLDKEERKLKAAVFIGRLISREKYVPVATGYGTLGNGFGHLGMYPAMLIVFGVKDVQDRR